MEKIPEKLEDNEYLLKIRQSDMFGFITKYNKNGTIPKAFEEWLDYIMGIGRVNILKLI